MNDKVHDEISDEDLMAALKETKTYTQISADDLKKIYAIAFQHAKSRLAAKILVRDIMTENVIAVQKFDDISKAARILSEHNVSGLPVVDKENHVIGIISEADVLASPVVADPLTLLEICATSDGAAALVLSSIDYADASENQTNKFKEFKNDQWYRIRIRVSKAKIETGIWLR